MNLTDDLLGEMWYWVAWAAWLPLFARSVWLAPWRRLRDSEQSNLWLGMIVLLVFVWSMKAGVNPALSLHLLGANVFTLAFGPHLAFVGLSLVTLGVTLNGADGILAYAMNALLLAGLATALSQCLFRIVSGILPRPLFIYIFVNAFIAGGVVVLGVGLASTVLLGVAGAYAWEFLFSEHFPYYLLLAFAEAWLSGMVITLFVVYRPQWVESFDDARYLSDK